MNQIFISGAFLLIFNIYKSCRYNKMKKQIFPLVFLIFFFSCNSNSEEIKAIQERNALQKELGELKFGAPNLLSDAKKFFEAGDLQNARTKLDTLLNRHSTRPEAAEGRVLLNRLEEQQVWNNALNSQELSVTYNYLYKYPTGNFVDAAKRRLNELNILNEQKAFGNAKQENSSSAWKKYLKEYPNHPESKSIQKKIIELEVDEIFGDKATGRLPNFERVGGDYSSNSSISIKNDTGCELTVRYSGSDVRMIEIPLGGTRNINLSSGSYRIAATACGANYAGTELLQGDYTSSYYISRSYSRY